MSKKKNQLFRIIASLKPTEKAYFKKFGFKQDKSDSVQVALFDLIDKQLRSAGEISEEKLIASFEKKHKGNNYVKVKSRLLEQVLDALREYDKKGNDVEKIYDCLAQAESLKKRNLFHDAWSILQKAEKLAVELELMELLIMIRTKKYYFETFAQKYRVQEHGAETMALLMADVETLRSRVESDLAAYRILHFQKSIGVPRSPADMEVLRAIQEHPSFDPAYIPPLQSSKLNLAVALSGIFFSLGDTASVIRVSQNLIDHYQPGERLRKLNTSKYLGLFDSFLQAALLSLNVPLFESYFPIFQQSPTYGKDHENLKRGIDLYLRAIYAIVGGRLETVPALLKEFDRVKEETFIPNYRKVSLAYYMSFGPFMSGDLDAAYAQVQWLKNNRHLGLRYDIEVGIMVMECVLLLEKGDFELLEYRLRALDEFLRAKGRKFEMEGVVLRFLRNALTAPSEEKQAEIRRESHGQLKDVLQKNPQEAAFLHAFDILSWLESKIEGAPFSEVYYRNNIEGKAPAN